MVKSTFLMLFFLFPYGIAFCQVGINSTGATPHSSAMLDVEATGMGVLFPRMTIEERDNIATPAHFLIICNLTTNCIEWWNDHMSQWERLSCGFKCGNTMTDIDNNTYSTVLIGDQCWMAENLRTSRDATGNSITRYCYQNNNSNCTTYGGLYTWDTAMNGSASSSSVPSNVQGICPNGWHFPSHDEWTILELALCESGTCTSDFPFDNTTTGFRGTNEGSRIKVGPEHNPAWNGDNSSGFTLLPAGRRSTTGTWTLLGSRTDLWSATGNGDLAWYRTATDGQANINRNFGQKEFGWSVRCVMD